MARQIEAAANLNANPSRVRRGMLAAVVTGFLASICCVGPLILVLLGVGGAWVADLHILNPFRPWLMGAALIFLVYAHARYWRQRRRDAVCGCAVPTSYQALWLWLGTALVIVAFATPYALPYFVMRS